jgi:hypothetical protein
MPVDTLADDVQAALRGASDYIRLGRADERRRQRHLHDLRNAEQRLRSDIDQRQNSYKDDLQRQEEHAIDAKWAELNQNPAFLRANAQQNAQQGKFDNLRQVNGGAYPRNLSPVLYVIPLLLVGIAEWYVNFSTFATLFIPAVAIAGTLIVAAIFAWASHLHGSYLKQLACRDTSPLC